MDVTTEQFIAGEHSARGSERFSAEDAASGSPLEPEFVDATEAEVDRACRAAEQAAPAWRDLPLERRAQFLEAAADELDASVDAFVERAPQETGLPEARIRGELGRTTGQLRLFAGVVRAGDFLGARVDHGDPDRTPAPKPDIRQYRVPLGPVAVFGASNFPLAFSVAGGDTASALAAGCPVVVKAHPGHPGTSAIAAAAIERAVDKAGAPAGVFSMVHGRANAIGGALVSHPAVQAVGFTGSQRGGLALARLAAERPVPIPVFAEMGSVNPMFLLPSALAERGEALAKGFAGSLTMGTGQFCTKPGVVFAPAGEALETFLGHLAATVAEMPAGVMLHSGILSACREGVRRLEQTPGVERVATGESAEDRVEALVFRTTLDVFRAHPNLAEEVFGPVGLIVEVPSTEAMPPVARDLDGQLTATVHAAGDDLAQNAALVRVLEGRAGRVLLNGFPTGVEVGHAMVHGGPYPATTDSRMTSVGTLAIERFLRPVCYQDFPDEALPEPLREDNPLGLRRLVDGHWQE
ncbi:MAG TPA: aldehyde dehydrogenase (NADP(+)) [Gammaproteobacteria bacterium]|nr:aldehyde dehydrogenase (NADP(+)) [Gammaproteobacteria bacterium]